MPPTSSANSHRVAVLEEGMKYRPIGISGTGAVLETRKFQINEIAVFSSAFHMLADLEKSSSATSSNDRGL